MWRRPSEIVEAMAHAPVAVGVVYALLLAHVYCFEVYWQSILRHNHIDDQNPPVNLHALLHYDINTLYGALRRYGPNGRALFAESILMLDILFPVIVALSLAFPLVWLHGRKAGLVPFVLFLPFDYAENWSLWYLATHFPVREELLAVVAGKMTLCKWITVGTMLALIVSGFLTQVVAKGIFSSTSAGQKQQQQKDEKNDGQDGLDPASEKSDAASSNIRQRRRVAS